MRPLGRLITMAGIVALLFAGAAVAAPPPAKTAPATSSLNYVALANPTELAWPKDAPAPKKPLSPLLIDWEGDGQPDLLVSDGAGRLFLARLQTKDFKVTITSVETIKVSEIEIALGSACQPNYADMDGDGLPDLIATRDGKALLYPNTGTKEKPEFSRWVLLGSGKAPVSLPEKTYDRLDVADWNRDGKLDLITAKLDGTATVFLNRGTPKAPLFEASVRVTADGKPLDSSNTRSIRFRDVTGDGKPDLVLGTSRSHIFVYPNRSQVSMPVLSKPFIPMGADGSPFEAKKLVDNYGMYPTVGDVNSDRVADVIFGNDSDKLFFARGIPK